MEGFVHPDFAPVTEKLHQLMSKRSTRGGAAVAVYHHGELVVDAWTGVRDAAGTPWERDTMATSFSTSKGVVATVVHRLVDRGELDYDDPVIEYWPEFGSATKDQIKDQITIRHLLTHQAAMHRIRPLVETSETMLDWDAMVAILADAEPAWEPGIRSGYHALTYGWLVGEVIRRITGLTVNEAVQREIVEPLGLDSMFIGLAPEERGAASQTCCSTTRPTRCCSRRSIGSSVSIATSRSSMHSSSTTSSNSPARTESTTARSPLPTGCSPPATSPACTPLS